MLVCFLCQFGVESVAHSWPGLVRSVWSGLHQHPGTDLIDFQTNSKDYWLEVIPTACVDSKFAAAHPTVTNYYLS